MNAHYLVSLPTGYTKIKIGWSILLGRKFKSNIIISTIYVKDNVRMHDYSDI